MRHGVAVQLKIEKKKEQTKNLKKSAEIDEGMILRSSYTKNNNHTANTHGNLKKIKNEMSRVACCLVPISIMNA